jgi:TIR domain
MRQGLGGRHTLPNQKCISCLRWQLGSNTKLHKFMPNTNSAVAFVRWTTFRPPDGGGGGASFDFGSNNQSLVKKVGSGGTLWLVTSTKRATSRQYHLAYKLVDCMEVDSRKSVFSGTWKFVVRARDWKSSRHFPYNNSTEALRSLKFSSGTKMADSRNMGLRLLSIPGLTPDDSELLEGIQRKIEQDRTVFISYARKDSRIVDRIESVLADHGCAVRRDLSFIRPGDEWRTRLVEEVTAADVVLVIMSSNSAKSDWVRTEIKWALAEYRRGRLVKRILPIAIDGSASEMFPELHEFQRWTLQNEGGEIDNLDHLIEIIQLAQSPLRLR